MKQNRRLLKLRQRQKKRLPKLLLPKRRRPRTANLRTGRQRPPKTNTTSRTAGMLIQKMKDRRLLLRRQLPLTARRVFLHERRMLKNPSQNPNPKNLPRTRKLPQHKQLPLCARKKRLRDVRKLTKQQWQPDLRITSDHQFAVFSATSILERRSCWTKFDRPTYKKEKLEVSHNRSVPLTSPSRRSNKRPKSSIGMTASNSRFPAYWLLIHLVTNLSPTCDPVDHLYVTLLFSLSILCTDWNPKLWNR